jgi:hypothetical protein
MNVPGDGRDLVEHGGKQGKELDGKWNTIGYAISEWGTTVRLLAVLIVLLGPAYLTYLIIWLTRR